MTAADRSDRRTARRNVWNSSRKSRRSRMPIMSIRERVDALLARLASEPQFPTQGETIFVDLERAEVRRAYVPRRVVKTLLGGRGVNMFLLHNLLDPSLPPLDPQIPLIFGTGILTSM